jgi:hypothetical protein
MQYHIASANDWLYPDSEIPPERVDTVHLSCARGGTCAAQILLKDVPVGVLLNTRFGGDLAPEVCQLIDVAVNYNTRDFGFTVREGDEPAVDVTRQVPFRVYDALKPIPDGTETRGETEALYLRWDIPRDIEPGLHRNMFAVSTGDQHIQMLVDIEVAAVTLPECETLRIVNWFSTATMHTRHGLEPWSEEHWDMIRTYGELMRRGHQTDFIPTVGFDVTENGDGTLSFDFSRIERLIRLFFDLGFQWINGTHVAGRVDFNAPEFVLTRLGEQVKATGPEGYTYLAQYLSAWYSFLERNGWLDRIVQHVADEPTEHSAQDYRVLSGIVRKFMPSVPILDALAQPELGGSVDVWVPIENQLDERLDEFIAHQKLGDELWYYTCCIPGGKYLNRLLDMPLIRCRYLHWANYRYGLTGYLHWGLNQFRTDQDPFEDTCGVHGGDEPWLPAGDTHVVYPGDDGPMSSARFEAEAMGAEDFELLKIVAASNPDRADEICQSCFRAFRDYSEDVAVFDEAHKALLEAAS